VHFYIDSKSTESTFEAGTAIYPFSNIALAFLEVFNYQKLYSAVNIIIHLQEGLHVVYIGQLPLFTSHSNITVIPWSNTESKPKLVFEYDPESF
jgi:hypothetical protein